MSLRRLLLRSLPFVVLLGLWQWAAASGTVSSFLLPRPLVVLDRIRADLVSGAFLVDAGVTLSRALAGLAIAGLAGALIGMLMGRSRVVTWFFEPLVSIGLPMPTIAFMPIFILWFGLTDLARITIVSMSCFFLIVSIVAGGAQGIDKSLLWSACSLGARPRDILLDVVLRAALPQIITALQIALPVSMIVALVAEMLTGGGGLGGQLLTASRYADSIGTYAGIVEIAATGVALLRLARFCRARLLHWHPEALAEGSRT